MKQTLSLIALVIVLIFVGSPMAKSCDEDDLTDYSTYHLLVVCTPVKGGYSQNPYYKGTDKCGAIK